ncbi:hypothetical protein LL06_23635 [Hoeflea sp. BAL378]|nr:hypothetical protein LL06_23635 [Hoeflea sp. BAL378]
MVTAWVSCAAAAPASAACFQELALYSEAQAGAEITFQADLHPAEPSLNRFTVTFPEHAVRMDGLVMMAGEPSRPWAMVMHNCPEGDATGAEIAACMIWEGPVYGIDALGNVSAVPAAGEGQEAIETILLPDFGAAVRMSSVWGAEGLSVAPKDDFRLSGCQE